MLINFGSKLEDIRQAVKGTWNLTKDDEWRCLEMGELKIYRKLCKAGNSVLPKTFIEQRTDITPYLVFEKDKVSGGIITLQEQYVTLKNNGLVLIIQS
jgi:hypothetical protein